MTIPDTDITWVKQSLNSIVNQYVRSWLEIRITSALDITQLSKIKFHICYVMLSSRFTLCQTVICNNLRKSWNNEVVRIYYDTNCDTTFYNSINSNLLKKLLLKIIKKKQRRLNNKCFNNANPRNKINMEAWDEISCRNLVQISFKAAK